MIGLREYKLGDIENLLADLAPIDFENLNKISENNPALFLENAVNKSHLVFVYIKNDNPFAFVGIIKNSGKEAYLWALVTPEFAKNSYKSVKFSVNIISFLKTKFNKISTAIDISYPKTIKLMHFLGFKEVNNLTASGATWMELNNV